MLLLIGAALAAVALFIFWVEPLSFLALLEPLTPQIVYRVQTTLPLIALSFDDGPHPVFTPRVLEILRCYDAKATFFVIGNGLCATLSWFLKSKLQDTRLPITISEMALS